MASWTDILSLILTTIVFVGTITVAAYVAKSVNSSWQGVKQSLQARGWDISSSNISIKTDKQFDHERYLDATQRGIVNTLGAGSFHRAGQGEGEREKKRRRLWGSHGGGKM